MNPGGECAGPRTRPPLLESRRKAGGDGDVVVDCSRWNICGSSVKLAGAGAKQRRVNGTVTGVLALFTFLWATTVFAAVLPWLEGSVHGVAHVTLFTAVTGTALAMYTLCVFADPGSVPAGWTPDTELGSTFVEVKKKGGEPRYCNKCHRHKPPRTHHCRQCDRCVLKMDHHCSWVNNCVGHGNYKSFFLFLVYVNVAVAYALCLLLARSSSDADPVVRMRLEARQAARRRDGGEGLAVDVVTLSSASQTLAIMLCIVLVVMLGLLLAWHCYLVASNKTTVEYHEGVRAKRTGQADTNRRRTRSGHIYDLGLWDNIHAALGPLPPLWLLPDSIAAPGSGLAFQTCE